MALFITFIHLPVEAKVKEEEKRSAVSAVFPFFVHMRLSEYLNWSTLIVVCDINTHWFVSQWSLLLLGERQKKSE